MVTQPSTSLPAPQPQAHYHHDQATATSPSRRPSPISLANFSFTQFFFALDEAAAEEQRVTAEATAAAPVITVTTASTLPSAMTPPTTMPLVSAATLSFHNCVLLKLSLTCALCSRLLRYQPAAIETCGHCFCYDCINKALENGCAPLMIEWPWCTLEKEVGAAEVRWAAATVASISAKSLCHSTAAETPGDTPQATEETADGHSNHDEVQVVASPGPRATPSNVAPPSRQPRKTRKVRQVCPLCLGPAFKWMLVPLQPLADLCSSLHSAYPGLEEALGQLTASTLNSAASSTASREASANSDEAQGQIGRDVQGHVQPASGFTGLITAAFAPRPSLPSAEDWRCSPDGEDEEVERRRRRSSGGPRKEITFAPDIASRVSNIPTPIAADAHTTANQASGPVAEVACTAHNAGVETIEEEPSDSAEAEENDGSVAREALAAALSCSADLIPAPAIPAPAFSAVTPHRLSPSSWLCGAELNTPDPTPLCPEDLLGHSPADASKAENTQQGGNGNVDSMVNLHLAPVHQHAKAAQDTADAAANTNSSRFVPPFFAAQHRYRVLLDTPLTPSVKNDGLWLVVTSPRRKGEAGRLAPPPTRLPGPPDSIDAILRARASFTPEWSVVWDGVDEGKNVNSSGGDEGCSCTMAPASQCLYSTVRLAEVDEEECAVREETSGESGVAGEHRRPVPPGAPSRVSRHTVRDALASVHIQDVWDLHTAVVRRHPQLPSCFAVLRHGCVRWRENLAAAAAADDSESAVDSIGSGAMHPPPPILCVVGHYPRQSCVSCRGDSSGLRLLPKLTPTACTALVLGVPCLDVAWVTAPTSAPWTEHAVSGWKTSTDVVGGAPLPLKSVQRRLNAFQKGLEQLTAVPRASSSPQHLTEPLPASWMATTQRALLTHLHPTTQACGTQNDASTTVPHAAAETYLYFLLPDGATRQLSEMLYHQWIRDESCQSQRAENTSPVAPTPPPLSSRKRSRDAIRDSSVVHGMGDWSVTDGHPQRAWRRLLLVAGGAAVELSRTLFEALVATAAALEGGGSVAKERSATDTTSLVNSLTSHLRYRHTSDTDNLWIHVDVADGWREPPPPSPSAGNAVHSHRAQHTLFLLYSVAVARDVFAQLLEVKDVRVKSACGSPYSSSPASVSPSTGEHCAARTCAHLRRFKAFLDRLATLVSLAAAPVLPDCASVHGGASHRQEARPSSWLLENIAQGRRSAGSSVAISPLSQTLSSSEPAMERRNAALFSIGECDAGGERHVGEAGHLPPQRVGVYRSLLYTDTP
ncbi:conserved RING finger protein [Leishmania braziliensis MHOM/BR/75/M2904]|uniref:Conserved RING finger protein n=1 Tax=Leishmania braziliensis TaxID=5660 RepID=A4HM98_LEIBR|nr:conserved RING finger protein [Leishmania braziliensis MHOM/BR/75/M2904]CAJ2480081.1 unnamed protein product [Leishmania braziliensis]CAM43282.1 conserved RING finger protein [Leishmania braziliensis MHOM/BR/75/M2904]